MKPTDLCSNCGRLGEARECAASSHRAARARYLRSLPGKAPRGARGWSRSARRAWAVGQPSPVESKKKQKRRAR